MRMAHGPPQTLEPHDAVGGSPNQWSAVALNWDLAPFTVRANRDRLHWLGEPLRRWKENQGERRWEVEGEVVSGGKQWGGVAPCTSP